MEKTSDKLWSGRFTESTDALVESFGASVSFDRRLYRHDIEGSLAHARMLTRAGVLTEGELAAIERGLGDIRTDIERGDFAWLVEFEDVHMNIEARLTERIGEAGKKLHTGRSRNDQVATDLRLYLRDEVDAIDAGLQGLQRVLLDIAEREAETIMPGFTHLQVAQPVTFGHHLMAWFEMLQRDRGRLADCRRRINIMPLGAAALAGTSYPIDRAYTAQLLGFDAAAANSLDAVSDRDFAIEFTSAAALLMVHLSRCSEELILWSSAQFGFIELSDGYCTGSSIMPQKKNPDMPELVRGKSGRAIGNLMALLTLMKGQPLAYNKDNQEDKEPLFDSIDTVKACLRVFAGMLPGMQIRRERMVQSARLGYSTATDLADYLVRKGIAFRDAHEIVGKSVRYAIDQGKELAALTLEELRGFSAAIGDDVYAVLTVEGSVAARNHPGGTAPAQVRSAIAQARRLLG
ncbi:MAG: argininosuccinate lyase [Gammaproteobacteria bacterium]|nr:argininosuccinate lyase [Gammaproteobacteria bacterium]